MKISNIKYQKSKIHIKIKNFAFCIVILIFAFCILHFLTGCGKKEKEKLSGEEVIPVKAMKVELQDIRQALDYIGNIKAQDEAVVYPKVSGKIIEKLKEDGSEVNKSDVFMYIDRDEVGLTFEKAPVESPLSGIIGRIYVDKGTNVTPQTPVALIVDMEKVKIELDIPEKYLPKILLGQDAEVSTDAYPEEKFIGKLSKISPVVDVDTRTAPVEILISNIDHRLKPGMFAKVHLTIKEHKAVPVILKEAVIGKGPSPYVYVVNGKTASQKNIKLGMREGPYFEVTKGLKEGDLVVIMGQQRLRDGVSVNVEEETRNQSTETR